MNTLSAAIGLSSIARTDSPDQQPDFDKVAYRGWVWLATFVVGTGFWVGLGYGVWALMA
jgi:hypothetical protein